MNNSANSTLYHLDGVQKTYNGRTVLNVENLNILKGEILGLVGPSGAGKSTLLRLLGFLEQPSTGKLSFGGKVCDEAWPNLQTRRKVTMVFQRPFLLRRTVFDNVCYGLNIRHQGNSTELVDGILDQLGLKELASTSALTLSGGEAQRVALARALVLQPDILLLDEPTSNLDPFNIKLIEDIVQQKNKETGMTVVVVTHNVFQADD